MNYDDMITDKLDINRRNLPHNYLYYPNNIFKPREVEVLGSKYKLFVARFNSLYSLYSYLKSNPKTNNEVFIKLKSEENADWFAGKPYSEALEDLIGPEDTNYNEFLKLQGSINGAIKGKTHEYKRIRTLSGGQLNIPAYSAGDPLCFDDFQRVKKPKFVKMYVLFSYSWSTSYSQIVNRAIIISNVIKALEKAGYNVDLETFELSTLINEIEYTVVKIKNHGQNMKMSNLYKVLCHIEFVRRIIFRVMETLDLQNDWGSGYGYKCSLEFTKDFLNITDKDIYFEQPDDMGIWGHDLADDFENAINHLNLGNIINVEEAKANFRKETMKLKLKK